MSECGLETHSVGLLQEPIAQKMSVCKLGFVGTARAPGSSWINAPQQGMRQQSGGVLGDVLRPFGNPLVI